eukprot:TRINITY_DN14691_c0_g1_i2.p1 TRINITY_DN14691_c0_g1~~TRINITY_DN14691_c0_g1_i2.p1  ORF type:complete len:339 (-),score=57.73 TRINITY_DN14691_c0_g1_i2:336-1298(-)
MAATLSVYDYLASIHPNSLKELIPFLVSILKQVIEHCLPYGYAWKEVPAPWIQIKILKVLSKLGKGDKKGSAHMYEVIGATLKLANDQKDCGKAIKYEAIITIARIFPNDSLLWQASEELTGFLLSEDHDLKYLGLSALNEIVGIDPKYANDHETMVLDCVESKDETIRFKTLQLLYAMANRENTVVIASKILHHLKITRDPHLREDLVLKLTTLCERFSPNFEWYVKMMCKIFIVGGDLVKKDVAYNTITFLAEGNTGDESLDDELRSFAVNSFFTLSERYPVLSPLLMKVICWIVRIMRRSETIKDHERSNYRNGEPR